MRLLGRAGLLVGLWLLAWGQVTVANVISGAAVAAAVLVAFPPTSRRAGRLGANPIALARLAAYVAVQLVISNVGMTRQVLRRRPAVRSGVLAHRLERSSEHVVTVMTSIIALSPGTMTVDVDRASTTIYVHFLLLHDVSAARGSLARLERLVSRAITAPAPSPDAVPKE